MVEKLWALASVGFEFKFGLEHFLAARFALFLHLQNKDNIYYGPSSGYENYMK